MEDSKVEQTGVNKGGTVSRFGTKLTRGCSRPVRYELIGKYGPLGIFESAQAAAAWAYKHLPDQEQDEDRTGKGWDISVVGADR